MLKRTKAKDVFDQLTEADRGIKSDIAPPITEPTPGGGSGGINNGSDPDTEIGEPDSDAQAREDRPHRSGRRRIAVAAVAAVVVGALAASAFFGWRLYQSTETTAAGREALDAAKNYAVVLTTLNAADIDGNYRQALDGATGEFKDQYGEGSAHLRQLLIDNQAEGEGVVVDAAVKSATTSQVEALLFVDQTVTNAVLREPRIDRNRVQMMMEFDGHRWLASKVEIV